MSIPEPMNVKNLIGYKLKKAQHLLRLHMDEAIRPLGLTTPQYAVLAQLDEEPLVALHLIENIYSQLVT